MMWTVHKAITSEMTFELIRVDVDVGNGLL